MTSITDNGDGSSTLHGFTVIDNGDGSSTLILDPPPVSGVTVEELRLYVNADTSNDEFIGDCLAEALALVTSFIGASAVPAAILDRAVLEVGSELFHRRNAPNGVAQFATFDGSPIRVARDPMVGAYPILQPFTGGGFA